MEVFRPIKLGLEAPLLDIFGIWNEQSFDAGVNEEQITAGLLLSSFFKDDPDALLTLLDRANPKQFSLVLDRLVAMPDPPLEELRRRASAGSDVESGDPDFVNRMRAKAILSLSRLGRDNGVYRESLRWDAASKPGLRTWLIHLSYDSGIPVAKLKAILAEAESTASIVSAVLLALGHFPAEAMDSTDPEIENTVIELFTSHPDPQVHSAARWLLKQWGRQTSELARLLAITPEEQRDWAYVSNGHLMATIRSPHRERTFAISMMETTIRQFQSFRRGYLPLEAVAPDSDCPVHNMKAEDAMAYCNWLSDRDGIPKSQFCYRKVPSAKGPRWEPVEGFLLRTGYRLPTSEEFLFAARGKVNVSRPFGESSQLLSHYAWFLDNSNGRFHPVGNLMPTGYGIYDALGNLAEWCHHSNSKRTSDQYCVLGGMNRSPRWSLSIDEVIGLSAFEPAIKSTFRLARTIPES